MCEVRALAVLPTKELAQQVRIFPSKVQLTPCTDVRSADVFSCAGLQSVHVLCRGDLSESGDAGRAEELCCRAGFTLRTQVSRAAAVHSIAGQFII